MALASKGSRLAEVGLSLLAEVGRKLGGGSTSCLWLITATSVCTGKVRIASLGSMRLPKLRGEPSILTESRTMWWSERRRTMGLLPEQEC